MPTLVDVKIIGPFESNFIIIGIIKKKGEKIIIRIILNAISIIRFRFFVLRYFYKLKIESQSSDL